MKLQVLESPPADWDEIVCGFGGAVFHARIWADYQSQVSPNAAPVFAVFTEDGRTTGAALAFVEASEKKLLAGVTRRMWMDALPVLAEPSRLLEAVALFEDYARVRGAVHLTLDSFASPAGAGLASAGYATSHRLEFELRLDRPEEELWEGMEYKRRKNIRKAARLGVVVEEMTPAEGSAALRRLQAASSQRIMARGGPDITRTASGPDPVEFLVRSGAGRIVTARVDGEPVSAGLFVAFNRRVYHLLSGHHGRALETQAPTFLLWETIRRFREAGAERLNFGGCSASAIEEGSSEHGVYLYKLAFGGDTLECFSGAKVLRPMAAAAAEKLRSVRRSLQS